MQGIAAIRSSLGLSQQAFALELGISQSLLSRAENRQRSLPMAALARLSALEIQLVQAAGSRGNTTAPPPSASDPLTAAKQQKKITDASHYEATLHNMILRYEQLSKNLETTNSLVSNAGSHFIPGHLELHRLQLLKKIKLCGPAAQEKLRQKIRLYKKEIL